MTRIIVMLLAVLMLGVIGCETSTPPAQRVRAETGQKAQLLAELERVYENPEAHYRLGKLYFEERSLDKAEYSYKTAIGFKPSHYRAQAGLVQVAIAARQKTRAQIIAELYISQAAVSAEGSLRLGNAFQGENLGDYAITCYYQASGLDPEWAEPYKQLGFYYMNKGDKVRAEENLRRSFELDPYQSDVSGELGRIGIIVQTPSDISAVAPEQEDVSEE